MGLEWVHLTKELGQDEPGATTRQQPGRWQEQEDGSWLHGKAQYKLPSQGGGNGFTLDLIVPSLFPEASEAFTLLKPILKE